MAQPVTTSCPETGLQLLFGLEYARRLNIFAHNLAQAQRLQQEDLGTAEFGETPFSDLTGTRALLACMWWVGDWQMDRVNLPFQGQPG